MTAFFAIFTEDRFGYNASANGYIFAGVGVISVIVQGAMIGRLIKNFTEKGIATYRRSAPGLQHVCASAGANANYAALGRGSYRGRKFVHQSDDEWIGFALCEQVLAGAGPGPHAGLRELGTFFWTIDWRLGSGLQSEAHSGFW